MPVQDVTGLVLAGGRGSRMGGVDKGWQPFQGQPLVQHALQRLRAQHGQRLQGVMLNANRHLPQYRALGAPVWPDPIDGYAGPLAGFLAGLTHCETPWLLTVPCDSPLFPLDLLERLAQAADAEGADLALPCAPDPQGQWRTQPVFCLLKASLLDSLQHYTQQGGRKVDTWTAQHRTALVRFDQPHDDPLAFANTNTLQELQALETDCKAEPPPTTP